MKVCNVLTTVCKQPMNCQYCEIGYLYSERTKGLKFYNEEIGKMIDGED